MCNWEKGSISMEILNTNLSGRIRNTHLPKTKTIMVLAEAVVNSIQAIDELKNPENGKISISILREESPLFDDENLNITGFEITDNGVGFNEENFKSFLTLDSDYKKDKGCHGMGRLLWLKVFDDIQVQSNFEKESTITKRSFKFSIEGITDLTEEVVNEEIKTIITLNYLKEKYKKTFPNDILSLANLLLQHCIWFFLREGGAPQIEILDTKEQSNISLNTLFDELMLSKSKPIQINVKDIPFEITHVKINANVEKNHNIVLCAANRVVEKIPLKGKVPGLYGSIIEKDDEVYLQTFVSSKYLDEHVLAERDEFDLDEENLFDEVSKKEIVDTIISSINDFLKDILEKNIEKGKERINTFVDNKAPRYKALLKKLPNEDQIIDPNISDKELDIHLHKELAKIEEQVIEDGHQLQETDLSQNLTEEKISQYKELLDKYLVSASELKQSDLASYVSHRRVILDLLSKALQITDDGKYEKESIIHNLIMPMKKESDEVDTDINNLWLINERLAFHNYLSSDKPLKEMPVFSSTDKRRPDILSLNVYDEPLLISDKSTLPIGSITIVELKRPMRDDMTNEDNPIRQTLDYLKEIRRGECKTKTGRPIPASEDLPGFIYIVADLTPSLKEQCIDEDLTETFDKMGYFGYKKNLKTYIEVISFDQLYQGAVERNKAFFDKLGLPNY